MNKTIITGYLGNGPVQRTMTNGSKVTSFSVAVNRGQGNKPIWYSVSAYGKLGDECAKHLATGARVMVEGRLEAGADGYPRVWKRRDETMTASFELAASQVEFLSKREESVSAETLVEVPVDEYPF